MNRRYNDFVALDAELRASTGKEPPQPLPPKHWFKRTLHDEEVSHQFVAAILTFRRSAHVGYSWSSTSA